MENKEPDQIKIDRDPLRKLGYGIYIVTSYRHDRINGQLANTVFQITSDPPQVTIAISKNNLTHEMIAESGRFAISILAETAPLIFIGRFGFRSGRTTDKFEKVNYKIGATGCPIVIENCVGSLEAEVVGQYDAGSHTLFIGRIVDSEIFNDDLPMSYDYYQKNLKGKTPPASPTYRPA